MPTYSTSPAVQSHLESQVNFMTELMRQAYDSVRKLSDINLHLTQQLMEDSVSAGRQILSSSDPMQASAALMNQIQPVTEHLRSYMQQLTGVLAGVQVDLTRTAETHLPQATRSASAAAEDIARRSVQAGSAFARANPLNQGTQADGAASGSSSSASNGSSGSNGTQYTAH